MYCFFFFFNKNKLPAIDFLCSYNFFACILLISFKQGLMPPNINSSASQRFAQLVYNVFQPIGSIGSQVWHSIMLWNVGKKNFVFAATLARSTFLPSRSHLASWRRNYRKNLVQNHPPPLLTSPLRSLPFPTTPAHGPLLGTWAVCRRQALAKWARLLQKEFWNSCPKMCPPSHPRVVGLNGLKGSSVERPPEKASQKGKISATAHAGCGKYLRDSLTPTVPLGSRSSGATISYTSLPIQSPSFCAIFEKGFVSAGCCWDAFLQVTFVERRTPCLLRMLGYRFVRVLFGVIFLWLHYSNWWTKKKGLSVCF